MKQQQRLGVVGTVAFLAGIATATVIPGPPTSQTIHIRPGDQVTVIADAVSPTLSPVPSQTPVVTPAPTIAPTATPVPSSGTATVVTPQQSILTLLQQGKREFLLRAGVHKFSLGSSATAYKNVLISSYPGEKAVIDGSGVESLVYLGPASGTWKIADVEIRNFLPEDQGVIGIGDVPARLEMTRVKMVGSGVASGNNDHGVYFHGTGSGLLIDPDISAFPGSALQTYRGNPAVEVRGGRLQGMTVGVYAYSGTMSISNAQILGGPVYDIDVQTPAKATLTSCTGKGPSGAVRRYDHS